VLRTINLYQLLTWRDDGLTFTMRPTVFTVPGRQIYTWTTTDSKHREHRAATWHKPLFVSDRSHIFSWTRSAMTAMLRPTAASSAILLTLPLDDTRDRPTSARYNGGVDAEQPHTHTHIVWYGRASRTLKTGYRLLRGFRIQGIFKDLCKDFSRTFLKLLHIFWQTL